MDLDKIIGEIKKIKEVKAIYLFGSHVKKRVKPFSDIDLCIITNRKISKGLKEKILSNSSKEIDISLFWDLPPTIKFRVIKEGKPLYERKILDLQRIKIDAINSYLDFKPLINKFYLNMIKNVR